MIFKHDIDIEYWILINMFEFSLLTIRPDYLTIQPQFQSMDKWKTRWNYHDDLLMMALSLKDFADQF